MGVQIIKYVDKYVGGLICLFLILIKSLRFWRKETGEVKTVAFLQFWGIGETLLTLPAIKAVKALGYRVEVIATRRVNAVFEDQPYIDKVHLIEITPFSILKFMKDHYKAFDAVIDFEEYLKISTIMTTFIGKEKYGYSHGLRGMLYDHITHYNDNQHVAETHMDLVKLFGVKDTEIKKLLKLQYKPKDEKKVNAMIKNQLEKNKFIIISPGVAESAKSRLWPLDRYAALADKLLEAHPKLKIAFVGAPDEKQPITNIMLQMQEKNRAYNTAGKFNLQALFYFVTQAKLVVSNDSGVMHIGAAMGTKTLGIFGPNLPVRWRPYGEKNEAIYKGDVCEHSPCINVHKGQVPECLRAQRDNICMKEVSVNEVFEKVEEMLK